MIINQSNLHGLTTGYSAAFNKALSEVSPDYKDIATVTSSSTAANDYAWLGQIPGMKEWIGDREVQHISEYGYTIKNKSFERTIGINRDAIEDDQYGIGGAGGFSSQHPPGQPESPGELYQRSDRSRSLPTGFLHPGKCGGGDHRR